MICCVWSHSAATRKAESERDEIGSYANGENLAYVCARARGSDNVIELI